MQQSRKLEVDGVVLELVVTRKRVKNINARLRGSTMVVSAPTGLPVRELESAVEQLARRLVRRQRADAVNATGGAEALARRLAARFPHPLEISEIRFVTTQQRRWGSYSARTGVVRLNAALRQMPPWVQEAVVAHELAHAVHADHSPAFWELLRSVCPNTDRARAFLEGVSWLAAAWDGLPPVERALLAGK